MSVFIQSRELELNHQATEENEANIIHHVTAGKAIVNPGLKSEQEKPKLFCKDERRVTAVK